MKPLVLAFAALLLAAAPARAADGAPDRAFGSLGKVTTSLNTTVGLPSSAVFNRVAIAPDGKLVAAGTLSLLDGAERRMFVARYNPDGSLDPAFGRQLVDFPNSNQEIAGGLVLLPGGDVVIAGTVLNGPGDADDTVGLARLRGTTGRLDPLFGSGGLALQSRLSAPGGQRGEGVTLVGGGTRLLVAGSVGDAVLTSVWDLEGHPVDRGTALPGNADFTYTGRVFDERAADVAPYGSGALIALATDDHTGLGLLATDANGFTKALNGGAFDNHQGIDSARWLARIPGASSTTVNAVTADPSAGRWVEVGSAVIGGSRQMAIARFTPSGPDNTFGGDGTVTYDLPGNDVAEAAAVQRDGRILVAGVDQGQIVLLRLLPNGEVDRSFGGDGLVMDTVAGSRYDSALGAAIDAGGKAVIVGGDVSASGEHRFLLARYGPQPFVLSCTSLMGCIDLKVISPTKVVVTADVAPCTTNCPAIGLFVAHVGRFPFGPQKMGTRRMTWDMTVNGKRLAPGRYTVRVRALRNGKVVERSRPISVRVPRRAGG